MTGKLDKVQNPEDLKKLNINELEQLSSEIRDYLIKIVAANGGHLSSSLGAVDFTIALHYIFESPRDKIVWDVGHQSYAHKLLTGRKDRFETLRQLGGLSGFPCREESEHDAYGTGHASTSISAALGLIEAHNVNGNSCNVIAVIGDGALTGGMALEALNHASDLDRNIIVVLNDNNMSIGHNVGALSAYLGRIRTSPGYARLKEKVTAFLMRIPLIGEAIVEITSRLKSALKYFMVPGILFEELGFTYLGPVDGHNIKRLISVFDRARRHKGPVLVHLLTRKGKGYVYAEEEPSHFHGVGPFDMNNGVFSKPSDVPTYTRVFGETLVELAEEDPRIVAITAAMASGTGLDYFASKFPGRFYDVGIAEQHAVTLAGGLATGGLRPVAAIYSTFMQRAYDQALHDLGVQKLPVVLALDRAGIVGNDGETHQGIFDLSYLRHIPNISIMAPKDENELRHMLKTALSHEDGPVALRYPRSQGRGLECETPGIIPWGKAEQLREGEDVLILAVGTMVHPSLKAADRLLEKEGISAAVINARFVKPLDSELITGLARECGRIITIEENVLAGGFGSACLELLEQHGLTIPVRRLGIGDTFVKHGNRKELLKIHGLDEENIFETVVSFVKKPAGKRHSAIRSL